MIHFTQSHLFDCQKIKPIMKKIFFLTLVFISFLFVSSFAQKKATFLNNVEFTFPVGCDLEKSSSGFRVSIKVNGKQIGVMGKDDVLMAFYGNSKLKPYESRFAVHTKNGPTEQDIYIGKFAIDEVINIRWDLWEDDSVLPWETWDYNGLDDEHEDCVTEASVSKGHIKYIQKAKNCVEVSYVLYRK